MGGRATGMNGGGRGERPDEPDAIEREIGSIRGDLDGLVAELDRRRHDALDWRLQLRRHRRALWIAAGVAGATVLGVSVARRRRRRNGAASVQELLHALRVVARNPEALTRAVEGQRTGTMVARGVPKLASAALPALARSVMR